MRQIDRHYLARPLLRLAPDGGMAGDPAPSRQPQTGPASDVADGPVAIYQQRPNTTTAATAPKGLPSHGDGTGAPRAPGPTSHRARSTKTEPTSVPAPRSAACHRFHPTRVERSSRWVVS
jgi:hypothetical protein